MKTDKEILENFKCRRCGNCCKWPGIVRLTDDDADNIAEYLGIPFEEFIEKYTRLSPDRRCLVLTDNEQGGCIFYREPPPGCLIQPVKPYQCGAFPEKWRTELWREHCAGAKEENQTLDDKK